MKDKLLKKILIPRSPLANKGNFGHTLIYAGSDNFLGAAYLTCQSAIFGGAGYVDLCYDSPCFANSLPEVIYTKRENLKGINLNRISSILFGNGLDYPNKWIQQDLDYLLLNYTKKLVVDATGLKYLKNFLLKHNPNEICPQLILTPHIKEFCNLFDIGYIDSNVLNYEKYLNSILKIFSRYTIILKSYNTLIKDNKERFFIDKVNPGLAKAGSGDCYSGLLVSFLAYLNCPTIYSCYASYKIFSIAGLKLRKKISSASFQASKVAEEIPHILKKYIK